MGSNTELFKTVVLESSTWAVVRTDPARPRCMEVIANFYDEKRAKDYADLQNSLISQPRENKDAVSEEPSTRTGTDLSQTACGRGRPQPPAERRFESAS